MGIALSTMTLMAVAIAGCTMDGTGFATGTVVFCVQDDPTVNFNGVFVNFGNVQINTATTGDNTINDNDTFNDGGAGTTSGTAGPANTTAATNATANETTPTTTATTTTTAADSPAPTTTVASGRSAETIQVSDVECNRLEARGNFDFDMNGQRNFETGDGENPGQGDENRGRSDSPCDHDQGFGNDWKCENGRASKDVETENVDVNLLEFQEGRAAFIARAELPPMTIDDACITIDNVRVTAHDGQDRQVDIEIDQVCIQGPIEVREGHETLAVLKVDLEQSLREEGDRVVFRPVVHIRAAAPVTQTITVHETVTQTVTTTASGNETTATTVTTGTTATFGTNQTASPTTSASPTNTTSGP